eukprot:CAMPEP_0201968886 /NCGR_PEP_ID=MMETSP0904-20121228/17537_1 /ASSEMBLY_ACC=CAM_ASM_000553 /TAXON_ID=420261 /ORGANISM="Thalassiosira antarctica, Strain CCMP982" /LENGTH=63 /DNA_ID=CAMNT_0048516939 /DNA_START=211 /DNA_END=405 /DNA_ORIENTATION=+
MTFLIPRRCASQMLALQLESHVSPTNCVLQDHACMLTETRKRANAFRGVFIQKKNDETRIMGK